MVTQLEPLRKEHNCLHISVSVNLLEFYLEQLLDEVYILFQNVQGGYSFFFVFPSSLELI